jgi:hypothetical protein
MKNIKQSLLLGPNTKIRTGIYTQIYRKILERDIGSGIDIMKQDWDNLILLDAYRADIFEQYSQFEGELTTVTSKGNWSLEFVVKNFQGNEFHDTICITANPYYQELDPATFYKLIDTGTSDNRESLEKTTKTEIKNHKRHPNKRLIIHYMQPHGPHMGNKANKIRDKHDEYHRMFSAYRDGLITKEILEQTYLETVRLAESEVNKLIHEVDGKTVVSSDHGENLGEIQHGIEMVEHGLETPECRLVPWLELPHQERREIIEEPPVEVDSVDEKEIEERLADLGYMNS